MKNETKIILIILLAAFLLRVPNINVTLAGDEIDLVGPARNFLVSGETYQYQLCDGTPYFNNTHPPFRLFFYSLWASIFGFTALAMRLVPMIFGLATIVLTYFLGRELYSERAGLVAAALMALSRYHIFASEIVNNDNTLFIFLFEAAMYFFVIYKKRDDLKFGLLSGAFMIISLYAKITFFLLFVPLIVYSLINKRKIKQDIAIIAASLIVFLISLYLLSSSDPTIFSGPLSVFSMISKSSASFDIYNKLFYIATITWQMTPFLSLLILISLARMKRDNNYWFLAAWIFVPLIAFLAGSGDVQRYVTMSLPAVFILLGKFLEGIDPKEIQLSLSAAFVLILALFFGLNDLMGYYAPVYLAVFYLLAACCLIFPKRNILLLGAAIGLSIYFAFSPGFIVASGGEAARLVIEKAQENGIPYDKVFTSKDVNFYLTPGNETTRLCEAVLDKEVLRKAEYIALYHLPNENVVKDIASLCETPDFIEMNGRTIGVVCKIR